MPCNRRQFKYTGLCAAYVNRLIQQFKDTLRRTQRGLQLRVEIAEGYQRANQHEQVKQEGDEVSNGQPSRQHLVSAKPEDGHYREKANKLVDRSQQRLRDGAL